MSSSMISHDLFEVLSPVLHLSRLFCLLPIKWIKTDFNYVLTKSKSYIIYSNVMVLFIVVASIYGLSQVYQLNVVYMIRIGSQTKRYVTFSDVAVVLTPLLIGVIETSLKIDKYIKYFDYLKKFDYLLQRPITETRIHIFVTSLTLIFTASILILDMVMWMQLTTRFQNIYRIFAYFFPYYVCYSFTMILELMYWQSVQSIKTRISYLNQKLKDTIGDDLDLFFKINKKKILNIEETIKGQNYKNLQKTKSKTTFQQIQAFITSYQKLTDAANAVNDFFGFILLIIILGCLIHLLVTPYALYTIIFSTGNSMFIVSQSIWMIGHVLRLLLIVEPCHGCLVESKTTSELVCKLLCLEFEIETKKSLEFFLSYLSECKIEFTAYGMTNINRSLLTTITGAVTTYLVILFQFNN